ncbi:MAG TPA: prepilin-type N-terminal cleavage/methylation domain-containing protein [Candidatus Wallbacteria bacterium]|nr:prepilin-type N-terminal cleavage/methylation domain-containing protein [Candidatus Wallbacteria bacterium]
MLKIKGSAYRGFTLIEIMTVMIIMSVIAASSYPAMLGYYHNRQLSSNAIELSSALVNARSLSIGKTGGKIYGLVIRSSGEYQIYGFKPGIIIDHKNFDLESVGAPYGEKYALSLSVEFANFSTYKKPVILIIYRGDGVPTADGVNFPIPDEAAYIKLSSTASNASATVKIHKSTGYAGVK